MFRISPAIVLLLLIGIHSPTLSFADDYDSVCGNVSHVQSGANQKAEYCAAANIAKKAVDDDAIVWKVYAAATAVCAYACAAGLGVAVPYKPWEYLCTSASVGAGVTDAVMTKNYMTAIASIVMPVGVNLAMKPKNAVKAELEEGETIKDDLKEPPKEKDWSSCMIAATEAVETFAKHSAMTGEQQTYQSNLDSARGLNSNAAGVNSAVTPPGMEGGSGSAMTGPGSPSAIAQGGAVAAASGRTDCSKTAVGTDSQKIIACAVAADPNLPAFVRDPKFPGEFAKIAKQGLGDFVASNSAPAEAMTGAMAGSLSDPARLSELAMLNKNTQIQVNETAGMSSGGGGGGHGSGAGSDDAEFGSMIAGMMKNLFPGQDQAKGGMTGMQEVDFMTRNRGPAAVTEARHISIFDRVSYRYLYVQARMISEGKRK